MSSAEDFRLLIPQPPGVKIVGATARAHAQARLKGGRARELFDYWSRLYAKPDRGDGGCGRTASEPSAARAAATCLLSDRCTRMAPLAEHRDLRRDRRSAAG